MRPAFTLLLLLAPSVLAQPRRVVPLGEGGKRWALVVGNDAYTSAHPLHNSVNDARGMATVLRESGFAAIVVENATREKLDAAVTEFVNQLGTGDVALFYYSGHGMQINGENYLIPVDLAPQDETQVRYRSVNANEILERMEAHGAALNVIVLDACRDNPFRGMRSVRGGGLALMSAGDGTLLAYATAPGKTADDNALGNNGLYTGYLIQALREPGLKLEDVFKRAGDLVKRKSNGAQIPFYTSSVSGDFYFFAGATLPVSPPTRVNPKDGLTYVWIKPGAFQMGCSPGDSECYDREKPAHPVRLTRGFWLGETPVTQQAYQKVMGQNPSRFMDARLPVESITWNEAGAYCQAIGGRLPTEAEWEYAARAGTILPRYGSLEETSWYIGNSHSTSHPVAQKRPNAFGLYDILGNVWQWTADWMGDYAAAATVDPAGPSSGQRRTLRGGSWDTVSKAVRLSCRGSSPPETRQSYYGVRCAIDSAGAPGDVLASAAPVRETSPPAIETQPPRTEAAGPKSKVNPKDGLAYVWVEPGTFQMGCSPGDKICSNRRNFDQPAHAVTITKGFWLGQTPVTQEAYQKVTAQSPSQFKGVRLPVEQVNWNEAQFYCHAISGRLPTEAEWEYAARAGSAGALYGNLDDIAWYGGNSNRTTHEVARKRPNAFGLYDMLGNVWQWTADWFGGYPASAVSDPAGPPTGRGHVVRGGFWGTLASDVRVSERNLIEPEYRSSFIGFRCVGP